MTDATDSCCFYYLELAEGPNIEILTKSRHFKCSLLLHRVVHNSYILLFGRSSQKVQRSQSWEESQPEPGSEIGVFWRNRHRNRDRFQSFGIGQNRNRYAIGGAPALVRIISGPKS